MVAMQNKSRASTIGWNGMKRNPSICHTSKPGFYYVPSQPTILRITTGLLLGLLSSLPLFAQDTAATATSADEGHHANLTDKQTLIQEINQIISSANDEMGKDHWQEANIHIKNGLTVLGYRYSNSTMLDDTGMKLVVADDFERKGLLEKSARLRLRILQARLDIFKENSDDKTR